MDSNLQNEEIIKNKMIKEYLYVIFAIVILYFLSPIIFNLLLGDADGIDGIGTAFGAALVLKTIQLIIMLIAIIINPIYTMISCRNEIRIIPSKIKQILIYFIIIFPVIFSALIFTIL